MAEVDERVVVVGAGLVGGSIALAARAAGLSGVRLVEADARVAARARQLELAEEVTDDLAAAVRSATVVIAAVPAGVVPQVLLEVAQAAPRTALLTDAASLKLDLTLDVTSRLRDADLGPERFVGGHPMAGSERSGPDAADPQLFQGASWVLTPTEATADDSLTQLSALLRRLGARVVALPPQRHDELVAIVSHLPQVVASSLAAVAADAVDSAGDAVLSVAGGGFRDTTRIAASDPGLWVPILRGNRAAVLEALDAYGAALGRVRDALAGQRWEEVHALLGRASVARQRLVPKSVPTAVADLVVAMDDRPGQLATATTALGAAGINVEDLTMRHAPTGGRGALLLRVAEDDLAAATTVLRAAGLGVHVESDEPAVADPSQAHASADPSQAHASADPSQAPASAADAPRQDAP